MKYASQLDPVDDIASIVKQPIKLAGRTQINSPINNAGSNIVIEEGKNMPINGIGMNVMKCVASGEQKVMLCQDALMAYACP